MSLSLKKLQEIFSRFVVDDSISDSVLADIIVPGGEIKSPTEALAVYQRAFKARTREAVGSQYDAVWSVLGDEAFFYLVDSYVRSIPRKTYDLTVLGNSFPDFLREETTFFDDIPYLKDLLEFEREYQKTLMSEKDSREIAPEGDIALMNIPQNLNILPVEYEVYEIWKNREQLGSEEPHVIQNLSHYTFYRNNLGLVQVQKWKNWQASMICSLGAGQSLEQAVDQLSEVTEEQIFDFFREMRQTGFLK